MIYAFEVIQSEFGYEARLPGESKNLSGVGETAWEAIKHLASVLGNIQEVEDRPQNFMGGDRT